MLPTVFTIPVPLYGPLDIKGYGLMMMIGFLTAIYLCMRRAQKVRCDPDIVLNAGFLALICGVLGARIFYVVHYWDTQFKGRGIAAAFDVRSGGLEFYGGFLAAVAAIVIYLWIKRYSVRLFLDIMAPSVMWGLAFGRLGCTLNGCCFGGTCPPDYPWPLAVTFPYGSPPHVHHLQTNRISLPRELLYINQFGWPRPIDRDHIAMDPSEIFGPREAYKDASMKLQRALAKIEPPEMRENVTKAWQRFALLRRGIPRGPLAILEKERLKQEQARTQTAYSELGDLCSALPNGQQVMELVRAEGRAWGAWQDHAIKLKDLLGDSRNPRPEPSKIQELQELAKQYRSHTVFFVQPMGFLNAMILSGVLSLFFYRRRVHGAVFGLMFILYPITRIILEYIRADNPLDSGGLTISQAISVGILPLAFLYMFIIYKMLPPQSPRAEIWEPPRDEPPEPEDLSDGPEAEAEHFDGREPESEPTGEHPHGEDENPPAAETQALSAGTKKTKRGKRAVETVVVAPDVPAADGQSWHQAEATCAGCGTVLKPPTGLIYQQRAGKRSPAALPPGVPRIESPDPNTRMELICESCFDQRPPQDKSRAKRLAKKWWKSGKV